jgi:predicted dehydrogenase
VSDDLRVGVVGIGALGTHHARVFATTPGVRLAAVYDRVAERAAAAAEMHGAAVVSSLDEFASKIDAAVVAVPTTDHAQVAGSLLEAGRHVLIEKPITTTVEDAERLVDLAATRQLVLQVGHVERFNPAAEALGHVDAARFVEVHRISPFPNRSVDIDVILDLMVHDLDLLVALDRSKPAQIDAVGVAVLTDQVDIANVRIRFESGLIANLTASRVSMEKIRKFRVFGSRLYASCDFLQRQATVARLAEGPQGAPEIKVESMGTGPNDPEGEPLKRQAAAFVGAIRKKNEPVVSGRDGLAVLRIAKEIIDKMSVGLKASG